jgi:hypothetical protein
MSRHLSLSDEQFEELRRTGGPLVVSTEEGGEVVVQDAAAYRRLLEVLHEADFARTAAICEQRWRDLQSGADSGVSAEELIARVRQRLQQAG